jgi:hypothetical protein
MTGTTTVAKALRQTPAYRAAIAQIDAVKGTAVDGERYRAGEGQAYLQRFARAVQQFRDREAAAAPDGIANRESRSVPRNP